MMKWTLKKGSEKKFRYGHPWVFSSELAHSPKSLEAGTVVQLFDQSGDFLAVGYGHPNSLISFRALALEDVSIDADFFLKRFNEAAAVRETCGLGRVSHRFIFAEGDFLPGLIIDRYFLSHPVQSQVFVIQLSTAGMDKLEKEILAGLKLWVNVHSAIKWESTAIVMANDSKSRAAEGLEVKAKALIKTIEGADGFAPENAEILIEAGFPQGQPLRFSVDFIGGQKTGFFLDQRSNIRLAAPMVREMALKAKAEGRPLRVLDLFCYVGQWGAQFAEIAKSVGAEVQVTLCDSSQTALDLAKRNVEAQGAIVRAEKRDVVRELVSLEQRSYDVVICDPPAFVKKKKDLETGVPAYMKLNREASRRTRPGGVFISCSCSGLFDEENFRVMLAKTATASEIPIRWVARGSHSADHPQRPEFPQGTYLKSWIGVLN
jgi:23S rRNA (cytosine1962-C5)-methyltransferase